MRPKVTARFKIHAQYSHPVTCRGFYQLDCPRPRCASRRCSVLRDSDVIPAWRRVRVYNKRLLSEIEVRESSDIATNEVPGELRVLLRYVVGDLRLFVLSGRLAASSIRKSRGFSSVMISPSQYCLR